MNYVVVWARAIAIIYIHSMDSRGIENQESRWPGGWTWAGPSPMSQLYAETKIFEGILVEKMACPLLQCKAILVLTFSY